MGEGLNDSDLTHLQLLTANEFVIRYAVSLFAIHVEHRLLVADVLCRRAAKEDIQEA